MRNPIKKLKSIETQPTHVEMGENARIAHNTVGTLSAIAAVGLTGLGLRHGIPDLVSAKDGVSFTVNSYAFKAFGGALSAAGVSLWSLTRGIKRVPSLDGTRSNSVYSGMAVTFGAASMLVGGVTSPETSASTAAAEAPVATAGQPVDSTPNSVVSTAAPAPTSNTEATSSVPADFGANCELVFADDGDGLVQGDKPSIYRFEVAANQAGYGPFDENGSLSEAEIGAAEVFKTAAAQSLGAEFRPGPDGQLTPQMCGFLTILVDGKLDTPPVPAEIAQG